MSTDTPSPDSTQTTAHNIAQELGADPAAGRQPVALFPSAEKIVRDLTREYPFAMLGIAFLAGAAFVGRRRGR